MEQFLQILLAALGTLVTALASWLGVRVVAWLNSKIKDKELARYTTELAELVFNVVNEVTQTYVSGMKKEGKFDKEHQKEALHIAIASLKAKMSLELTQWVEANYGDLEKYLTTLVESAILMGKR